MSEWVSEWYSFNSGIWSNIWTKYMMILAGWWQIIQMYLIIKTFNFGSSDDVDDDNSGSGGVDRDDDDDNWLQTAINNQTHIFYPIFLLWNIWRRKNGDSFVWLVFIFFIFHRCHICVYNSKRYFMFAFLWFKQCNKYQFSLLINHTFNSFLCYFSSQLFLSISLVTMKLSINITSDGCFFFSFLFSSSTQ